MERAAHYVNANPLVLPATYITISIVVVLRFPTLLASIETLSFNFPNPDGSWPTQILNLTGDAAVSQSGIALTVNGINASANHSSGRATYYKPLHLWDHATGRVADFTSNFCFVIQADPGVVYVDGLTFFLTPNDSGTTTPVGSWDPSYEHVGIDINDTGQSVNTTPWKWYNFTSGGKVYALVVYNFSKQTLVFNITDANDASSFSTVSYHVNLKDILPESVSFGFSATTTRYKESHTIHSWNFISSLEVQDPPPPPPPPKENNDKPLPLIITGAGSFLLLCIVLVFLWSRRQSRRGGRNPS